MAKITFLGTNGWYDTDTGNTICVLIETKRCYIVLDAGNGLYKLDRYIKDKKPIHLFLSHFHFDHIAGLHVLAKFKFKQGICIYGPPGTKSILDSFVAKPFTAALNKLPFKVTVKEISEGRRRAPVPMTAKWLYHSTPCMGYRFEVDGKTVTYCTDTGICDSAVELGREADIFITECALPPGMTMDEWPHLNPENAAFLAGSAAAKKLILTHFDAAFYTKQAQRKVAERTARKVFKNSFAAKDGDTFKIY